MKKTYKDFGEAMDILRVEKGVSFDTMSFKLGLAQSYLWGIANRRKANMPKDELIIKIAGYFDIDPSYFYEWRLKRMLEFLDSNREFLDHCEKEARKYKKGVSPAPAEADTEDTADESA
jgi:transcriptional regulator with XRE-family HTH domain